MLDHFNQQLDKLRDAGVIQAHKPQAATGHRVLGSGALAAGAGAQAVGAGGVIIGGSSSAPVNTGNTGGGAVFFGAVRAGRDVVGRDKIEIIAPPAAPATAGEPAAQQLAHQQVLQLAALQAQLLQQACRLSQPLVVELVQGLQSEAAKPAAQREPGLVPRLLEGLVDLVPAGLGAVVGAFASPVLGWKDMPLTTREWYCTGVGLVKLVREEPAGSTYLGGGTTTLELKEWK